MSTAKQEYAHVVALGQFMLAECISINITLIELGRLDEAKASLEELANTLKNQHRTYCDYTE